jgi:hypothetical protein
MIQAERDQRAHADFAARRQASFERRATAFAVVRAFDDYRLSASGAESRPIKKIRVRHGR